MFAIRIRVNVSPRRGRCLVRRPEFKICGTAGYYRAGTCM